MNDRTVHARYRGVEVARYDRSGKWYLEPTDGGRRTPVTLTEAVDAALSNDADVLLGVPGGKLFDAKVRRRT